ncbi:MAG: sugar phosphate isomerase/epimerase [Clostridia bacterium]|nr:sugar phosphate isomerase/epimerase [Clostridia bacterium]
MKLGVLVNLNDGNGIEEKIKAVKDMGFTSCQICCWDMNAYTDENVEKIQNALNENGVTISTLWCGWRGKAAWNFYEGQNTLGLVPNTMREERTEDLLAGSDFGKKLGVTQIATHVGFLPENPMSETYTEIVELLRRIAGHCKENGQYFLFETGQETPVTLRRTIEDIGLPNLGINLDPANLILYGKANPVDALDTFGQYVRDIHGKDGCYPTNGRELGEEKPLGEGKVNYPAFIARLKEIGYDGPITIEREIDGDQQIKDILMAKEMLEELIAR